MKSSEQPQAVVVDDNPLVLLDVCHILEEAGFDCLDADNGDGAWHLLSLYPSVTLLFSDVEMPGSMNGFELARRVAQTYPDIEVVLASGRMKPEPHDLPGKTTFIPKPFSPLIVREHLKMKLPEEKLPEPLRED